MGAALVGATFHPYWTRRLNEPDRIVLIAMALTALDSPRKGQQAGVYWAGHEALAVALAGDCPKPDEPGYPAAMRRVSRACTNLARAGAIRTIRRAAPGRHALYELTLDNWQHPTLLDDQEA